MKKIMFNEPFGLQQATFDDTKTMTRRIVPQVILDYVPKYQQEYYEQTLSNISFEDAIMNMVGPEKMFQRYVYNVGEVVAIAQRYSELVTDAYNIGLYGRTAGWNNKMFVNAELMPRHIKIIDRKLERLQDISHKDCLKEGIMPYYGPNGDDGLHLIVGYTFRGGHIYDNAKDAYANLIDKVSGKGTWQSNPLVFAYEYKRID